MDTDVLVESQIDEGWRLLTELVRDGFDVSVAFWALTSDEKLWFLFIGSTSVTPATIGEGYGVVYTCLTRIGKPAINLSEVKLVSASNPIAQDAMAARDRYPGRMPVPYHGKRLGGMSIDQAYIYPRLVGPMTPSDVLQTVTGLMSRSGFVQPVRVTFRDGTAIRAIPISVQVPQPGRIEIGWLDVATNLPRLVEAGDVVNIQ